MSKLKTTQLKQYSMTKKQTDRRLNTTKENQYFFSLATTPYTHTHTHTPSKCIKRACCGSRSPTRRAPRASCSRRFRARWPTARPAAALGPALRGRPRCWAARRRGCRAGRPQQKSHRGAGRGRSGRSARPPEGAAQEGK